MAFIKTFGVLVLLAGVAAVALVAPPILYGQNRAGGSHPLDPFAFRLDRSAIGVSVREAEPRDRVPAATSETSATSGPDQAAGKADVMPGVVIDEIEHGGPAEKAGLKDGDRIVQFDGDRIRSVRQFTRLVEETPQGRAVDMAVVREDHALDVHITPAADRRGDLLVDGDRLRARFDELNDRIRSFNFDFDPIRPQLGVTVQPMSPQLLEYFGAREGILVSAVADGSPAAKTGLRAGDVITSVNGEPIRSRADLIHTLNALSDSTATDLSIGIVREKKETTVSVRLEPADRQL